MRMLALSAEMGTGADQVTPPSDEPLKYTPVAEEYASEMVPSAARIAGPPALLATA